MQRTAVKGELRGLHSISDIPLLLLSGWGRGCSNQRRRKNKEVKPLPSQKMRRDREL